MKITIFALIPLIFSLGIVPATSIFAEEQVPGMVASVRGDPFYFSEGGFGISILKFYEVSLEPYLVSGETTEESSIQEILTAYEKSTENTSQEVIVNDQERAQYIIVSFSDGEFKEKHEFSTFDHNLRT